MIMKEAIAKGCYGYVERRRKNQLIKALLCALVVVALVVAGIVIFGTKKNWIMIPAMLMVIPMANFLVTALALIRYESGSPEMHDQLKAFEDQGMLLSDLVVVNEKGARMFAPFMVVYRNGVVAYGQGQKWQPSDMEIPINDLFKRRGIPMRIKVYRDWDRFLERLDGMEAPDAESQKRVEMAREAILSTCL